MSSVNSSTAAVIGLVGTIAGVIIGQLFEILRGSMESKRRQREKIIDRRIAAHEAMLALADALVLMNNLSDKVQKKSDDDLPRGPKILQDKATFEQWLAGDFVNYWQKSHVWLSTPTKRELNLLQDYLANLYKIVVLQPDEKDLAELANNVREDFIDFGNRIRKSALTFLSVRLNLKDLNDWHKFRRDYTLKHLRSSRLYSHYGNLIEQTPAAREARK
jgi:hypothetical protein